MKSKKAVCLVNSAEKGLIKLDGEVKKEKPVVNSLEKAKPKPANKVILFI
jgi:hypothetical protein